MMLPLRIAVLITASLAAIACGGGSSPTSPSPVTPIATTPTTPAPAPVPAPVTQTATGTWTDGFNTFTLTQNGSSLTGMQQPTTVDMPGFGNAVFSGTIAGSASGANVTMTFQVTMTVNAFGDRLTCRGADSFAGQLSGNSLSGTYTPNSSPYVCDGGIVLPLPQLVSGPRTFTRQ